jgi:hypothetical protein
VRQCEDFQGRGGLPVLGLLLVGLTGAAADSEVQTDVLPREFDLLPGTLLLEHVLDQLPDLTTKYSFRFISVVTPIIKHFQIAVRH